MKTNTIGSITTSVKRHFVRAHLETALRGFFAEHLHDLRLEVSHRVHFPLAVYEVLALEVPDRRFSACDLVQVAPQGASLLALDVAEAEQVAVLAVLEPFASLERKGSSRQQNKHRVGRQISSMRLHNSFHEGTCHGGNHGYTNID